MGQDLLRLVWLRERCDDGHGIGLRDAGFLEGVALLILRDLAPARQRRLNPRSHGASHESSKGAKGAIPVASAWPSGASRKGDTGNSPRDLGKMGGAVRKWFSRDIGVSSCRARRERLPEVTAITCSIGAMPALRFSTRTRTFRRSST